jgi:2-polyprenyl-3-methyl-5-hydroxy-6-metoxy-1,4-benzoquinol methylase
MTTALTHDFALESGERQTAAALADVRYDHRVRYARAIDTLRGRHAHPESLFALDVFCGTGYGTHMLAAGLSCAVLGIDGSADAVAFAERHYGGERTLYVHKVFPFQLPRAAFDFVTCFESLEHAEQDELLIERLTGALRCGGLLFVSVPNEAVLPLARVRNPFHHRHYLHEDLLAHVQGRVGLRLVRQWGQDVYRLEDGKVRGELNESQMGLQEDRLGQFNIYVFER